MSVAARLLQAIQGAVPAVTGVRIGISGDSASVVVEPAGQQAASQATINSFDWSASAQTAWEASGRRDPAKNLYDLAEHPLGVVVRALALVTLDEINLLRTNAGLATRTTAQLRTAVRNKIDSGAAD